MEDIYTISLDEDSFNNVLCGKKIAHLEVNDKTKKGFAVGNQLTFVCKTETEEKRQGVVIENLLYFNNITEAVETLGREKCGFKNSFSFEKTSDVFLSGESYEDVEKFGIIAIMFKIM